MSEDIKFEDMVSALVKPGKAILESLTSEKADLLHMGFGITGEVGELIDALKRYVIYEKDLDRDNVIEELGDIEFFLEHIRQLLNITREETLHQNIEKLKVRYEGIKYSNEAAQNRADKA